MPKCKGKTKAGKPCKREAGSNAYCSSHKKGGKQKNVIRRYRSRSAKGWIAPKKGKQREDMSARCGAKKCFLVPDKLKFPVCPEGSCTPSCKGAMAAKLRARILAATHPGLYPEVESRADKLLREMRCESIKF